ncbi:MAG: stage II sporulation protein D [Sporomusaceae bacterium]|jgi:stage II sporulation protein D|nr:stage II sporulation protein D [Sporomusaceae bacterium]
MRYIILFALLTIIGSIIFVPAILTLFVRFAAEGQILEPPPKKTQIPKELVINVYLEDTKNIISLNLEEYVKKVVAAEMPAEFELEAVKAQAVASRTYAVKQMKAFGGSGHPKQPGADISSSYAYGQAFAQEIDLRKQWGEHYEKYWDKITAAVDLTQGLVLTYNGEIIRAAYHSTSGAKTASAGEVWGVDYPYLKSVECSWDKLSPRYFTVKEISLKELREKLGAEVAIPAEVPVTSPNPFISILERTESGRVRKIKIGAKNFSGEEVREKLKLLSTNFTVERADNKFFIKTTGYGHGVGLCQYGANGQAKEGRDFRQILNYYYQDVTLRNIFDVDTTSA